MTTINNLKISLRNDDLSNWIAKNPVLNKGELAIVNDEDNQLFKIGNGLSAFEELPYFNENQIQTNALSAQNLTAKSIAQGFNAKAIPLGFAAGAFLSANANFSQALGYNAETQTSDEYAFVWNGDNERELFDYYKSHGPGTMNINPLSGLDGFYIGEQTLNRHIHNALPTKTSQLTNDSGYLTAHQSLSAYCQKSETSSSAEIQDVVDILSVELSSKVCAGVISADGTAEKGKANIVEVEGISSLSVVHIPFDIYAAMLLRDEIDEHTIYFVDQENINAYDQRMTNLADGVDPQDAVTVKQMDSAIGNINSILEALN